MRSPSWITRYPICFRSRIVPRLTRDIHCLQHEHGHQRPVKHRKEAMSRRPESSKSHRTPTAREPLESLVYAVLPELAPPRKPTNSQSHSNFSSLGRSSTAGGSRPGSRLSRPDSRSSGLDGSVRSPLYSADDEREERERRDKVKEVLKHVERVMERSVHPDGLHNNIGTQPMSICISVGNRQYLSTSTNQGWPRKPSACS